MSWWIKNQNLLQLGSALMCHLLFPCCTMKVCLYLCVCVCVLRLPVLILIPRLWGPSLTVSASIRNWASETNLYSNEQTNNWAWIATHAVRWEKFWLLFWYCLLKKCIKWAHAFGCLSRNARSKFSNPTGFLRVAFSFLCLPLTAFCRGGRGGSGSPILSCCMQALHYPWQVQPLGLFHPVFFLKSLYWLPRICNPNAGACF